MNFWTMKQIVDAAQKKAEEEKNAIEKKFTLPAVGASDAASADEPKKTRKTKKSEPVIPEGPEADNVLPEDVPEDDEEE
jgi:hypothetical protein